MEPAGRKLSFCSLERGDKVEYQYQQQNWLKILEPQVGWAQIEVDGKKQLSQKKLTEGDVSRIMKCLIETVDFMHQQGFIVIY